MFKFWSIVTHYVRVKSGRCLIFARPWFMTQAKGSKVADVSIFTNDKWVTDKWWVISSGRKRSMYNFRANMIYYSYRKIESGRCVLVNLGIRVREKSKGIGLGNRFRVLSAVFALGAHRPLSPYSYYRSLYPLLANTGKFIQNFFRNFSFPGHKQYRVTEKLIHANFMTINRGACFRWSFGPLTAWRSIESTTILTTHPSLILIPLYLVV